MRRRRVFVLCALLVVGLVAAGVAACGSLRAFAAANRSTTQFVGTHDLRRGEMRAAASDPSQSPDSHANDRWSRTVRDGEECVKVRVEGDDRLPFTPSAVQNVLVGRLRHSDRAGVNRFETEPTERLCGGARQTLVKQEFHALLGRSITLSSSAAAA